MATEIDIPESVLSKEVKIEDNAFSLESLEEKVRESVDNKVKQLEASNLAAEPVNTKLETGIMTNASETFFQTLSDPTVTADEHINIPETSKDTPKQEGQEEIKVTKIEALTDEKPVDDVVEAVSTQTEREVEAIGNEDKNDGKIIQIDEEPQEKEQALNTLENDQVVDSNEQDLNEMPREFIKEETEGISNDAQEASEQYENGPNEEREQKPEESVKNIILSTAEIKQEEKTEEFPGVEIEEGVKQNGLLHEEKGEEVTQSDDGQKEKSGNPLITEVREENSLEKIEYKSSTPIATVNKDEAEEKEQDVNVLEKDQGEDGVTSIQDMIPEGGLEETKHQDNCNEAEVKAKESMEKEIEEIKYSVGTPENIEPQNLNNVIPTDVGITAHTKPEETMQNEEQNDVEAIDIEDGKTKDSGSSMVKEIYEEPVSDKANTEEGLTPSESSNKETIENDVVSKDEGQEKNDVECSQDEPSTGDLEAKTNETFTNDEKATEKEASDETGPENAESEVGLKVSGSMEPTKVEVLSTIEKNQGDTDGVISSQDATCEDIKETKSGENETTVADTEELNETPREFKEEAAGKSIDSEASYHSENKAEEKLVEHPNESLNEIEQKEEIEDIRPSAALEEKLVQVETWEHEEKDEAEATHGDDGQTEKFDNPAVTKVCEENSSEKVESESSSVMLNEQVTSILTKDEDEEKEQEVTVVEKDKGEDSVTSAQDLPFEGCLEETNHDSEGIEPEVVNAKGSAEEDTRVIKSSAETLEEKEQTVNPTDVSITTQTKQEEETKENEEKNDEKAMKSDYDEAKESVSPIVSEICEVTVTHNTESVEGLKVPDTSSTATNEHEIASKDDTEAQVEDQKEDDVTLSQAATSTEDLQVENNESVINEEKNDEEAIEKEPCEDMGTENVESEVGLKVSDSMEPSVKEAFSMEEKDQGDTDGVPRSQDETCVDVKETTPTIVGDFKELSETPKEFIKEETEDKAIDAQETNDDYENKAEDKLLERPNESVKEIEKEEEIEEIRPSVEIEEKLEKNELLLQGVTTDASISTQTEPQDEITEPDNKDEEEASQSDDGQKEKYDNSSINEVCEEISSEKVESESSSEKLNEIETSIVNKDEDGKQEQEVIGKDQGEDGVTSEQNVLSEGCLEEENHDNEGIEPEIVDAKGSTGKVTEEIRSSVETPEEGTPETEGKNDEEAIKCDDGQTKVVNEICEETVSHNTESAEGLKVSHTPSKENEHELASKDETEEKEQVQEEDDVTVSQTATSIEYLQVENSDSTIKEEDNEKEACEDLGADIVESGVGLKTSDSIELSGKEAPSTVEKEQDDMDGVPSSQDAASEDIKYTTSTIVSDFKELNEMPREIIEEKTEDTTTDAQEEKDDCENKAEEKVVEHPDESVKEIEHEEDTVEIRTSVEIKEKLEQNELLHDVTTDPSISTQTKSQDEITEYEGKDDEEATQSDDGQKEKNDNSLTNEVCEEISSEKVESEISIIDVNEKETSFLSNDGDDEKEQEVAVLEKVQEEDGITSAKDVPSEACLEETSHDNEGIESEAKNAEGSVEDDTKEIRSSVETPEEGATENKEKDDEEAIKSEGSQTKESGIPIVDEICEETVSHNAESEEGLKVSDISSKETNEHELASKDETEEKEQDHVEDDVTCSQDATSTELQENKKESTEKEDKNDEVTIEKVASEETNAENAESEVGLKHSHDEMEPGKKEALDTIEKGQGITSSQDAIVDESKELNEEERPREFFKEETEDKFTDAQEANEKCENGAEDHIEQIPEESVKKIEQEEEKTEETTPHVEIEEQNELLCDVTSDDSSISTQTKPQAEAIEHEEKNEEVATQSDDSQNEKSDKPSIKEVCEEEKSETVGYETSIPITVLNKDEDQEHDQAVNMLEKDEGGDDVASAQNATPTDVCISTQTILEKESIENEEKNAEEVVESDDSQTKKSGSPVEKGICEEIVSEKDIKVEDQENEQELDISEKSQNGGEDLTSSQNAANEDIKETTIAQHVTAVSYSEEGPGLSAIPTEILKEETEDKSIDAQEASEYEDREMPKEIVSEISSKNEQEVSIEEIKPSEEKDVCISTPEEAQEEATQIEEMDFHNTVPEEVIDLSNSSDVNQNEKEISILSKDEVQETEQELKISDKEQDKDEVTCSQDAAAVSEADLQGKCEDEGNELKLVEIGESTKEDNGVILTSVEPEERVEQQIESLERTTEEEACEETVKEKSIDPKETTDVEPQEDIMPSSSLETSTEDTSNSEKTKAESEDLPVENVESVSEVQNPEVVPESKDLKLKEECINSTTSYVEEEKEIVMEEIASNEKTEQPVEIKKEGVEEESDESITEKTEAEEGVEDEKSTVETNENTEQHGVLHVITTDVCSSAETKPNEDTVKDEEKNDELGQPEVKIVEEILEKKEDDTTKEKEDLSHDSTDDTVLDESTRDIEPQEDITPSSSSEILTTHTSNSEKVNSECENLPTEELKSVLEVQIAEVEPKTEESNLKEECIISATETHVDAEQVTVTKEISSDQILEPYGEKKLTHESTTADHIEETILQQEESDIASEKNQSVYEKGDLDEEATQANQLNSAEDCSERVKDVVLTKELSYSDPIPDGSHKVTEVIVDSQIGQEDIPAAEDISCESTLEDDNVDKAPNEEKNPCIEGAAKIEPQVDSSNIESTACPPESETPPTQSLESVSEVIEGSEDSKVKENCIMLETAEHTDVSYVEEEKIISDCISSAPDTKEDNVKQAHFKSEEEKSSDLTTEAKALTAEVDAESQTESGDIQAVEDLSSLSKASYTIEGATEDTENTPNLDLEKEEKDNEMIYEVQTPESLPKMGIKGEHPEATKGKCEALTGGELSQKLLDADVQIDTKEDIEVIAKAEEKAIEESNQDAVAEVTVHEHLQQTEEILQESKLIEDNIDEEASCIQNSTEDTLDPKQTVEKPAEVCEFTSEATEKVTESTEASPKILLVKHDSDIATTTEKNEDEIKEKDAILQAPNLSSESHEGKQNSIGDVLNKEGEVVQPQEHIFSTKSDVEIKEEVELTHSGSQQTSVDKQTEDSPVLLSEEKEQSEEASVKDAQKDVDHMTKVTVVDVINAECSDIEPQHLNTEEATLPSVNHENQTEQKKEADNNIDATIHIEDVKSSDVELQSDMDVPVPDYTSTRKLEVRSPDLEVPSAINAADEKMSLGSTCDKSKTTEEVSGIKQEPLELDAPVNTVATEDLDISHKGVTGDIVKISQIKTEIPKNEISAKPPQIESIESKISAQNVDASHAQGEPTAKLLNPEPEDLKAIKAPGSEPQRSSEVTKEGGKMSDVEVKSESAATTKEEIADSGVKTDEENEEQEDNEDNENSGLCSETPVMVEASKDMEVKVHKKSHNILSGVGSKVKHSIAKVKKAITGGKSSSPKSTSPKERD